MSDYSKQFAHHHCTGSASSLLKCRMKNKLLLETELPITELFFEQKLKVPEWADMFYVTKLIYFQ